MLARILFNLDFSMAKILSGIFFILLGIKVLTSNSFIWPISTSPDEIFFRSVEIDASGELPDKYQLVFSRPVIDLTEMQIEEMQKLSLNNVFSGTTVFLPSDMLVKIEVDAVFAGVKLPGINLPFFGSGEYMSEDFDPRAPYLYIRVNAVFGNVVFLQKQ